MCIQIFSIWLQLQLKSSRLGSSSHRDRKKWTGGKQRPDCAHQFVGVLRCDVRVVGPRCETILVHEARCILIEFLQELFGSFLDCLSPGRRSRKQNQDAQNRHLPGALTASQQITVLSRVHSTPFELSYKTRTHHSLLMHFNVQAFQISFYLPHTALWGAEHINHQVNMYVCMFSVRSPTWGVSCTCIKIPRAWNMFVLFKRKYCVC